MVPKELQMNKVKTRKIIQMKIKLLSKKFLLLAFTLNEEVFVNVKS